jgi:hypothetical protein
VRCSQKEFTLSCAKTMSKQVRKIAQGLVANAVLQAGFFKSLDEYNRAVPHDAVLPGDYNRWVE